MVTTMGWIFPSLYSCQQPEDKEGLSRQDWQEWSHPCLPTTVGAVCDTEYQEVVYKKFIEYSIGGYWAGQQLEHHLQYRAWTVFSENYIHEYNTLWSYPLCCLFFNFHSTLFSLRVFYFCFPLLIFICSPLAVISAPTIPVVAVGIMVFFTPACFCYRLHPYTFGMLSSSSTTQLYSQTSPCSTHHPLWTDLYVPFKLMNMWS